MDDEKYIKLIQALTAQCEDSIALIDVVRGLVDVQSEVIENQQAHLVIARSILQKVFELEKKIEGLAVEFTNPRIKSPISLFDGKR